MLKGACIFTYIYPLNYPVLQVHHTFRVFGIQYLVMYSMLLLIREFAQNTSICQEARIKMDPKRWLVEMTYIQ